ncbi:thymidylate kinase-like [Liolophura sinensis]|uniref:thymidylate kinase-like n=1 Tax=Liolophura sinensis TaxID=3198878 RepID=UPI0031581931
MNTEMSKRGALIVFEGCDRCGKTTQCKKLVEVLENEKEDVQFLPSPDRKTVIGKLIDEYLNGKLELDDHVIHLLFSANRWEAAKKMKELLQGGTTLIVDRYAYSGVAYRVAKKRRIAEWEKRMQRQSTTSAVLHVHHAIPVCSIHVCFWCWQGGLAVDWCKQPDVGLPKPDLVIYLTLSPEKAARREDFGRERFEQIEFQKKVAESFEIIREKDWKVIDADKNIEDLHAEIKSLVKKTMKDVQWEDIRALWT